MVVARELKMSRHGKLLAQNLKTPGSFLMALLLGFSQPGIPSALAAQTSSPPETGNPTDAASQSAKELQALVAPIALYPDSLVAQILTASTFPDQVAIANYWLEQN